MSPFNKLLNVIELRSCFIVEKTASKTPVKLTFGSADGLKDRTLLLSSESENRTWGSKIRKSIRGGQCLAAAYHNWRNVWETKPQRLAVNYLSSQAENVTQHEPVTQYFNMLHAELVGNDVEFQTARLNTRANIWNQLTHSSCWIQNDRCPDADITTLVMLLASFSWNCSCPLHPPLPT